VVELAILLLSIGAIGYVVSFAVLSAESDRPVVSTINFACVVALVIGILVACNKVIEVKCPKCKSEKVVSASVKYCDVCGNELTPVNEK
jgi:hypothetical protein